jgi:ABC-type sulfate/molybdate transport systems ATPase subunit
MIRLNRLCYSVGDFALREIDLDIREGEYFVLLGRPGSGKTILLECIAGLRRLATGEIWLHGKRVDQNEPAARNVGYVPQDYALFRRMTTRENIAFGLRARGAPHGERQQRVEELASLLGIARLLGRRVPGLSGGERQRVALARALAIAPRVLLLDEPVNALDRETRDDVLNELRRVHGEVGTTTLHVCHDLDEMRTVADRVAILHEGTVEQVGTPQELAREPASSTVARLLRLGAVLRGEVRRDRQGRAMHLGDLSFPTDEARCGPVDVLVREAQLELLPPSAQEGIVGKVRSVLWRPASVRVEVEVGDIRLRAEVPTVSVRSLDLRAGNPLRVVVPPSALHVLPVRDEEEPQAAGAEDAARPMLTLDE